MINYLPLGKLTILNKTVKGFSLIELIIGIVVLGISMALISRVLSPQAERSIDPIFQVRAAELAQGMMEEISSKAFDESNTLALGNSRCGEVNIGAAACTTLNACPTGNAELGESRLTYDDVDDYNCLNQSNLAIESGKGESLSIYSGFSLAVAVGYDDDMDGITVNTPGNVKLITVTVTTPNNEQMAFSTYRFNY